MKIQTMTHRQTHSILNMLNNLIDMGNYLDSYVRSRYQNEVLDVYTQNYANTKLKKFFYEKSLLDFDEMNLCYSNSLHPIGNNQFQMKYYGIFGYRAYKKIPVLDSKFGMAYSYLYFYQRNSWFKDRMKRIESLKRTYSVYAVNPFELTESDLQTLYDLIDMYIGFKNICDYIGEEKYPVLDIDGQKNFIR